MSQDQDGMEDERVTAERTQLKRRRIGVTQADLRRSRAVVAAGMYRKALQQVGLLNEGNEGKPWNEIGNAGYLLYIDLNCSLRTHKVIQTYANGNIEVASAADGMLDIVKGRQVKVRDRHSVVVGQAIAWLPKRGGVLREVTP